MEVFNNLPPDKKERIINGAMSVFSIHGYHKTSAADIANAAAISKSMVFTYFGSKRGCYEFLCDEMLRVLLYEFNKAKEKLLAVTDFFDRVILSSKIKVGILKYYPSLLSFSTSVFTERDDDVRSIITKVCAEAYKLRDIFLLTDIDSAKFKNPSDAVIVNKIITWMSYGCADEWSRSNPNDIDSKLTDFINCVLTLKKYFYKEECNQ